MTKLHKGLVASVLAMAGGVFAAEIHMAPNGDDMHNGASPNAAVATLNRAFDLATSDSRRNSEPMRIVVHEGVYRGQSIVLDGKRLGFDLTLIGAAREKDKFPVFAGDGEQSTWLKLKGDGGQRTGLTVQGLEIRNYATAISLEGNRDFSEQFNAGTTIRRNRFYDIGSIALRRDERSTAAVRFVNSKDNIVDLNYFHTIRSKKERECPGLHALYIAHFSSGNRITNNTFDDACGAVVRFRDRANHNVVEGNRFVHIRNAPAIEEWYCDMGARKDCTKKLGECPSTGNVQRRNSLSESVGSEMVSVLGGDMQRQWCSRDDYADLRVRSN